jgi:hypothetical protein
MFWSVTKDGCKTNDERKRWKKTKACKPNQWATVFSQPLLCSTRLVKKRKPAKNSSNTLWVKPQKVFSFLNDIGHVRRNIVKMTISHLHDTLCNDYTMFVQCPRDVNAKNQKIEQNKKMGFFKFLTNTCKKWSVDSTYTLL